MSATSCFLLVTLFISNVDCEFFETDQPDNYAIVYPLLKKWSENHTRVVKKLTIVFDDYEETDVFEVPRNAFNGHYISTSLLTLSYLMSLDSKNKTPDYHVIETGNCVLLLCTDILRIRRILKSPHLSAFWQPENFYILQETGGADSSPYDDRQQRFLEWALERLWQFRRISKIVVCVGGKLIHYDPFKYENHLGRNAPTQGCETFCTPTSKSSTVLSVIELNDTTDLSPYIYEHRQDFDGYPLVISVFETATMLKSEGTYGGLDFKYVEEVTRMMNVTPVLRPAKDKYGWHENGTFFGTLGDIVYRHSDVTFNQFFIKHYSTMQVQSTVPVMSDRLCVVVPKAPTIPEYLVIVRAFTPNSWCLILLGNVVISMIYMFMRGKQRGCDREEENFGTLYEVGVFGENAGDSRCRFRDRSVVLSDFCATPEEGRRATKRRRCVDAQRKCKTAVGVDSGFRCCPRGTHQKHQGNLQRVYARYFVSLAKYLTKVVLQVVQPFEPVRPTSERLLVISGLTMSLILNGVFTSKLTSSFSKLSHFEDIHTLEDLDKSGLTILTESPDLIEDALSDNDNPVVKRLRMKMQYANETEIIRRLFGTKDTGFLQREGVIPLEFTELQRDKLHIVEECPKHYILAHLIAKGSPFAERMNSIIGGLNNGGFYDQWFKRMFKSENLDKDEEKSDIRLKLTMKHFSIPFVILFLGLLISSIVFFYERRRYSF